MFLNHFKITFRTLLKNKGYSLINIGGLAIGMAVAMLIGLWVWDELSFDKPHEHYDQVARVMQHRTIGSEKQTWWSTMLPLADELRKSYGDNFERVARSSFYREFFFVHGNQEFAQTGMFMEPEGPEIFTLDMVEGSRHNLKDASTILISESMADVFFGDEDPMGKTLVMSQEFPMKVAGVYKDFPNNSSFEGCEYFASWELYLNANQWIGRMKNPWGSSSFQVFVQIAPNMTFEGITAKIKNVILDNVKTTDPSAFLSKPETFLFPMKKWHLHSDFENGINAGGRIQYVWLFGTIGIFVLLLACINFMNLSTARSEKRAKEVGVRKTIGSSRSQLIGQFYGESLLVAVLAFGFAIALVQLSLPWFNEIADKDISLIWSNPKLWASCLGFTLFTGFLAGSYPAIYLSSFKPVKVLKGTFKTGRKAALPRKALVVVQFAVSTMLIVGTVVVYQQIEHARNRPVGYSQDHLVMIRMRSGDLVKHFPTIRDELKKERVITEMAYSSSPVTSVWSTNGGMEWPGKDPELGVDFPSTGVSHDFGKTVGWEFVDGRDFDSELASDSMGIVINEAFADFMNVEKTVGTPIKWGDGQFTILGITKNMVVESPYEPIRPHFYYITDDRGRILNIKLDPNQSANEAIAKVEASMKRHIPVLRSETLFVDESFQKKFEGEKRVGTLASIFAILAIFISCLGLFGLASYVAEQRTKEIGIRKVLGASILNLWHMLSKDFVMLVLIACVVAVPISFYFANDWLQNFSYRLNISWWVFVGTGAGLLGITLLTVSFQAIKAALANPVNSLRNE